MPSTGMRACAGQWSWLPMLYLHATFEGIVIEATVKVSGLIGDCCDLLSEPVPQAVFMFAISALS